MKQTAGVFFGLLMLVATQLYADEPTQDEVVLKNRAYEFMTQGWGGEAIRGYETAHDVKGFFHRVGKVIKENIRLIKRKDNPSVNDEFHTYQYDGMKVSVYLARMDHEERVMFVDVVITSSNWPVKYGLGVGTTRKKIEATFGKSMGAGSIREWTYGDGLDDITYTFDKDDKVISMNWHAVLD